MSLPQVGLQSMLKGGTKNLSGLEEAVFMNIKACKELSSVARTSLGPHGLFKMIVNRLEKLVVTKNALQLTSELEVKHPAAKMVVMAAANQALEYGDGTNLVITLAGELLQQAEVLLQQGIVVQDVVAGYESAFNFIQKNMSSLEVPRINALTKEGLRDLISSAIQTKQFEYQETIGELVAEAVLQIVKDGDFNADFVRVAKIQGGCIEDSYVVRGLVVPVQPRGTVLKVDNCKIAVFSCPIELRETETKGTILLENAEELKTLSKNEEKTYEELILSFKAQGINVIVSQMQIHELALHYCNKHNIMVLRIASKFETQRFAVSVGAEMNNICRKAVDTVPTGFATTIFVDEVGDKQVIVCRDDREEDQRRISTIVLRAATENLLNDVALSIGNGINVAKVAVADGKFVAGAGATELELSLQLKKLASVDKSLEQYSIRAFAEALEIVPRTLAETAGYNADAVITQLAAKHSAGFKFQGVDIEAESTVDCIAKKIFDSEAVKLWAMRSAVDAACSILRVDQVVMRKQAGGPKNEEKGQQEWN